MEKLNCPRCGIVMGKIKKKDIVIDVCPKCRGLWLDDEEIDKLLEMRAYGKREIKKK